MSTQIVSFKLSAGRQIRSLNGVLELPEALRDHDPRKDAISAAARILADVYGNKNRRRKTKPLKAAK